MISYMNDDLTPGTGCFLFLYAGKNLVESNIYLVQAISQFIIDHKNKGGNIHALQKSICRPRTVSRRSQPARRACVRRRHDARLLLGRQCLGHLVVEQPWEQGERTQTGRFHRRVDSTGDKRRIGRLLKRLRSV